MQNAPPNADTKAQLTLTTTVDEVQGRCLVHRTFRLGRIWASVSFIAGMFGGSVLLSTQMNWLLESTHHDAFIVAIAILLILVGCGLAWFCLSEQTKWFPAAFSLNRNRLRIDTRLNPIDWLWTDVRQIRMVENEPELVLTHRSGSQTRVRVDNTVIDWLDTKQTLVWLCNAMNARKGQMGQIEAIPDEIQAMRENLSTPSKH